MLLDILLIICIVSGFVSGFRKGLIRAVFSFAGLLAGILLALKYSYVVSDYFYSQDITQSKLVPLVSFILVLFAVIVLVGILGKFIERIAETLLLGTVNRLIGGLLEAAIVVMVFSTILWYFDKMHLLSSEMKSASRSCDYLLSLAPAVTDFISNLFPFFRDAFERLEKLFEQSAPSGKGSLVV